MKHFALVLHAGDWRRISERQRLGLSDEYRHHTYAVATLELLKRAGHDVSVIHLETEQRFDKIGVDDIRYVGLGPGPSARKAEAFGQVVQALHVTDTLLCAPAPEILSVLTGSGVRCGVLLADSFPSRWRNVRRYRALSKALGHPRVDLIANHHLNSSRQLSRTFGIPPQRVIPWDWPLDLLDLSSSGARVHPRTRSIELLFVGSVVRDKGVREMVVATHRLRRGGWPARVDIVGSGDVASVEALIRRRRLDDDLVEFHGQLGGAEVVQRMRRASFICIPSRHCYPEGLPLTLFEGFASGTPVIASDHPMFRGVVEDGDTGFVFRAGSSRSMARAVLRAWDDVGAYERVSRRAAETYAALGLPTLWGDLVLRWVRGCPEDLAWIAGRSLQAVSQGRCR